MLLFVWFHFHVIQTLSMCKSKRALHLNDSIITTLENSISFFPVLFPSQPFATMTQRTSWIVKSFKMHSRSIVFRAFVSILFSQLKFFPFQKGKNWNRPHVIWQCRVENSMESPLRLNLFVDRLLRCLHCGRLSQERISRLLRKNWKRETNSHKKGLKSVDIFNNNFSSIFLIEVFHDWWRPSRCCIKEIIKSRSKTNRRNAKRCRIVCYACVRLALVFLWWKW